jgi:hypothetical protein
MLLEIGAHVCRHGVVNQVVEEGEELCAGHFSPAFFFRK